MASVPRIKRSKRAPSPFNEVVDVCHAHGWDVTLCWGRDGHTMDVREQGELLARGTSKSAVPNCFGEVARLVREALEVSGRLDTG